MRLEPTAKARILALLEEQPEDSSYDDLLRELGFQRMVELGLRGTGSRRLRTEEIRERLRQWHG